MKTFIAIAVTFLLTYVGSEEIEKSPFVVGGVDTSILDHPYMAKVHVNWQGNGIVPFCGGSIINRRSILTGLNYKIFLKYNSP